MQEVHNDKLGPSTIKFVSNSLCSNGRLYYTEDLGQALSVNLREEDKSIKIQEGRIKVRRTFGCSLEGEISFSP